MSAVSAILWPEISAVGVDAADTVPGSEPALLEYASGRKVRGALLSFSQEKEFIEFLSQGEERAHEIRFSELREVRLTRSVRVDPAHRPLASPRDGMRIPRAAQPFRIEFVGGGTHEGETLGWAKLPAGTFLLLPSYREQVIRTFFPKGGILRQQIGLRLGEELVADRSISEPLLRLALGEQSRQRSQRLGEMLAENAVVTPQDLHAALEHQRSMPMVKLGQVLVDMKLITEPQLALALQQQQTQRNKPLGQLLVELQLITREDLGCAMAQKLGVPFVDLKRFPIDPDAVRRLPGQVARELASVPVCMEGSSVVVAMANPLDSKALAEIQFAAEVPAIAVLGEPGAIDTALAEYYGSSRSAHDLSEQLGKEIGVTMVQDDAPIRDTDNTLVQLVNKIINDAQSLGASDIHIECERAAGKVVVRFRRDGVLTEYLKLPAAFRAAVVSRIKVMADLDISERRRGQDGRIDFARFGGAPIELRVAVLPTVNGLEDIVMRVLSAAEAMPLERLGMPRTVERALAGLVQKPHGLLLVCGPTGSGKTTTLHALLRALNRGDRKIWTAEDPIEITQPGLRQVQVNPRIGWTFASALRMFLRADPDVIMVGEMRDAETSSIALEAALTGHLVLSTLHTNGACDTVVRLLEMGMDPFNFSDSLLGVLGQRLVRRLCPECRSARVPDADELNAMAAEYCGESSLRPDAVLAEWRRKPEAPAVYEAHGCAACGTAGYKGRIGLYELLVLNSGMRGAIQRRASTAELGALAVAAGMRTMKQNGIEECLLGMTDLHEVRAVAS